MNIPLSCPDLTQKEIDAVTQVLRTPQLSLGPTLLDFERRIAEYVGREHAVAVSSGTAALHLIVRALGIGPGDEVVTTPFSFISSANCMLFEHARPVFVDIDPVTLNMDVARIEKVITPRTRAILTVDVFGLPADWTALEKVAGRHGLTLIEDSCEALGAEYHGRKAGTFGRAAAFAFYPNKQMTMGEGGAIVTDDAEVARLCRSMRNQGRGEDAAWLQHERLGYNYRLSELHCALGVAQLERLDELLAKRERVAGMYNQRLGAWEAVSIPCEVSGVKRSWFVYVVVMDRRYSQEQRDTTLQKLQERGIGCSNYFTPIHLQPFYRDMFGYKRGDFPTTEQIAARTIALPFYGNLSEEQVEYVVTSLREALSKV